MEAESKKWSTRKIISLSIVAAALAGAFVLAGLADLPGTSIMSKLFVFFLGAIIVMQIVPAAMLVLAMFKGVRSLFTKDSRVRTGK